MFKLNAILVQVTLIFLTHNLHLGETTQFPSSFTRCPVSPETDNKPNECLRNAIENAIIQFCDVGNPELGLEPLDPLDIQRIYIEKGESSPIAIKLEYLKNVLTGISSIKITSVIGKLSSPNDFKLNFNFTIDRLVLHGNYSVSGKVLILPVVGNGISNLTLVNTNLNAEITGQKDVRKGKEYLKDVKFNLNIQPERVFMNFDNLFNGDKALGDNFNKFLNANWYEIYSELQSSIEDVFAKIFQVYTARLFGKVQYKSIILME